ncbi:putative XK-related domain-containing protein 3 [Homarus americanus]|uniref:XK-related protein n=1 Tax=Homarus americanus TaxID=6706 RepID=A0A8J5J7J3_HOMAM|nr:putative XK-related domain-containing protein 3 [Homarus americanus]
MTEAWETSQLNGEAGGTQPNTRNSRENEDDDQRSSCCCGACGPPCTTCCGIFMKYTVGRALQLVFYVLDIITDVGVAMADYHSGDVVFASITIGLVFAPGFLFALFAFTEVLTTHTGILACLKAPLWLISFPILPLWPVARDVHQIYHGAMALIPSKRAHHLKYLNRPSRAYLLKFLEAFTEAAPQILLRLYKITLRRQELPFSQIETIEAVQLSFSMVTLASKVISTYQKNVTTNQIINGDMEENERFKLPCLLQIMAFLWWVSFLVARFEVLALFAGSLKWWIILVIGSHVVLVFLFQTVAAGKNKVAPWFPYTLYSILLFIENSVMLVVWYFTQQNATSNFTPTEREIFTTHRENLIFIHYGAFCFGLLMMIMTFCCASKVSRDIDTNDEGEMRTI